MRMEQMQINDQELARSIIEGGARVCASRQNGAWGWVLPGRVFTTDRREAERAARIMAGMM